MRKGFVKSMIAGGVIGAAIGALFSPRFRPTTRERLMRAGGMLARKAEIVWKRARRSSGLMEK